MTRASLLAVVSAASLAACASLPAATPARVAKAPASYETTKSFEAPVSAWPADQWWKAYGDAQLDGLIDEALKGSPSLAIAQARVVKAQSQTANARSANLPSVSVNGHLAEDKESYNNGIPPEFVPHGYNDISKLSVDFSWDLDFWGKNRAAIAAASGDARAAQAEAAATRLMISASVASAYANLGQQWALRDIADRAVHLREETLKLTIQRRDNGAETDGAVRQAEAELHGARADLAAQDEGLDVVRHQIAALLGAGPDRGLAITRPPLATVKAFGLPSSLAADLIGRRPDVTAARWRAEASADRVTSAKAAFYPNINLTAYAGYQALNLKDLFISGSNIGQVGPAFSLPIFEGGQLRAGLRGAQADRDAAVASFDDTVTKALQEVADAAAGERALGTRLSESRAAVTAGEDAYRIARLRYDGGLGDFQSVLLAEQTLLSQRRALATLESRALQLDVALIKALGGGFADAKTSAT